MKNALKTLTFAGLLLATYSCNKREIVPAPEPKVDKKCHFFGRINGADVELTENVNGYTGSSAIDLIVNSSTLDSAAYLSTLSSTSQSQMARVGHGSLVFDWGTSERPMLSNFQGFFSQAINLNPNFSTRGLKGFCFTYVDIAGREWKSNSNHSYLNEKALYTYTSSESDATGDYLKFQVEFDTYIYRTWMNVIDSLYYTDSMLVTDAVYTGWYKR